MDNICETPGMKIRSGGRGRGLAKGGGRGPIGVPYRDKDFCGTGIGPGGQNICLTPGQKIRSKGAGRGLARGGGRGPMGVPYSSKRSSNVVDLFEEEGRRYKNSVKKWLKGS